MPKNIGVIKFEYKHQKTELLVYKKREILELRSCDAILSGSTVLVDENLIGLLNMLVGHN